MSVTKSDDRHRVNAAAVALLQELREASALQGSSSSPASWASATTAMTRVTRSMPAKAADITARKPLANVIHRIDAEVTPRRCITLIGCVHPTTFRAARQRHRALPA